MSSATTNKIISSFFINRRTISNTVPKDVYIPGKFKKLIQSQQQQPSVVSSSSLNHIINNKNNTNNVKTSYKSSSIVTSTPRTKIIPPMSVNRQNHSITIHDQRMLKYIKLELNDIIQTESLPFQIQSKIIIVRTELTPNKKICIIWWRPFDDKKHKKSNEDLVSELLDQYKFLFKRLVGLRMSQGVNVRKLPKFSFKRDFSGEFTERTLDLMKRIEMETAYLVQDEKSKENLIPG